MKRFARRALSTFAVAAVVLTAAGCSVAEEVAKDTVTDQVDKSLNEAYELTYEVTGTDVVSVIFNGGRGTVTAPEMESVEQPGMPWTKTVTLKGIAAPTVAVVTGTEGGDVTCKITYKGKVLEEQSAKGRLATATCAALSPLGE